MNCKNCLYSYTLWNETKCYHPAKQQIKQKPCWRYLEDRPLTKFDGKGIFQGYDERGLNVFKTYLAKYGTEWGIAALIDGSIGYYTYQSAKNFIIHIADKRFWYAERTGACFNGDPLKEILTDLARFEGIPKDKQNRILKFVEKTKNLSSEQQMTISMLYPTITF